MTDAILRALVGRLDADLVSAASLPDLDATDAAVIFGSKVASPAVVDALARRFPAWALGDDRVFQSLSDLAKRAVAEADPANALQAGQVGWLAPATVKLTLLARPALLAHLPAVVVDDLVDEPTALAMFDADRVAVLRHLPRALPCASLAAALAEEIDLHAHDVPFDRAYRLPFDASQVRGSEAWRSSVAYVDGSLVGLRVLAAGPADDLDIELRINASYWKLGLLGAWSNPSARRYAWTPGAPIPHQAGDQLILYVRGNGETRIGLDVSVLCLDAEKLRAGR